MDTKGYREWYRTKVEIADEIAKSHEKQSEPDAEIILCCANSALAAQMWPGDRKDQKRFIEFLIRFAAPTLAAQKISIPMLANKLEDKGELDSAIKLRERFLPAMHARVIDGTVDQDESVILEFLTTLSRNEIRESSYAASIYMDLRCALIHEYQLSSYLEFECVSDRTDIPSYVNWHILPADADVDQVANLHGISVPEAVFALARPRRRLCFPYNYIRDVMISAAESAFNFWDTSTSWNQSTPQPWWIEG